MELQERINELRSEFERKQALRDSYEQEYNAWEKEKEEIKRQTEKSVDDRLNAEADEMKNAAEQKRAAAVAGLEAELAELCAKLEQEKEALSSMKKGFKRLRKEEEVLTLGNMVDDIKAKIDKANMICAAEKKLAYGLCSRKREEYLEELSKEVKYPEEPKADPEIASEYTDSLRKIRGKNDINAAYKDAIYETLKECGALTVSDVMAKCDGVSGLSNMRVSAILRQMVADGDVCREEIKRMAYFYIAE